MSALPSTGSASAKVSARRTFGCEENNFRPPSTREGITSRPSKHRVDFDSLDQEIVRGGPRTSQADALRKMKLRLSTVNLIKAQTKEDRGAFPYMAAHEQTSRPKISNAEILKGLLLDPLNLLLFSAPMGVYAAVHEWQRTTVFTLCFIALVPLAKLLGDATEHLAENLNQTIGGLLNATFGNAVEMIITVHAIRSGLLDIVQKSLLGSILSNLLLVLGMSLFAGGVFRRKQTFNNTSGLLNVTMLLVGVMSFSLPTVFAYNAKPEVIVAVSRLSAIFVAIGYCAYLVFTLCTHAGEFAEAQPEAMPADDSESANGERLQSIEEEEPEAVLSTSSALGLLMACTVLVSFLSEYMVASIGALVTDWHVPKDFVAVILLPIVGNACEHASAVRMAYNDKVVASIAIAVGSSTQIALLVMPFSVLIAWCVGQPLDFNIGATGLAVLALSVLVVLSIVMDGSSNWLEGFFLVLAYCLVAVLYWYTGDEALA